MSIGNPHRNHNVHRKRQRAASQGSIERRSAKKARPGPHHQFSRKAINLNATSFPRQSTTRRAATDVGYDTKQERLDFHRTSEERHSLPPSPLPSVDSPQRLPLTEESLQLLNNGCLSSGFKKSEISTSYPASDLSPSDEAINACHSGYLRALEQRQVFFADKSIDGRPPGLDEWKKNFHAPRKSPQPVQASLDELRRDIDNATNERSTVERILTKVVHALSQSDTAIGVADMKWKSTLSPDLEPSLTFPKPARTIGWTSRLFVQDFPKACASLETFMSPVAGAPSIAWPLFTIEVKGERGNRRVARLQNLHNGAVMLSNLYALKQMCKREESFFDKVHAMTIGVYDGVAQLPCYCTTRSMTGQVRYLGEAVDTWSLLEASGRGYREARCCIHNAIEWVRSEAQEWIRSDLQSIEDMLISVPLSQITPPGSR